VTVGGKEEGLGVGGFQVQEQQGSSFQSNKALKYIGDLTVTTIGKLKDRTDSLKHSQGLICLCGN
jgi:hypothetical protein